MHTYTTGRKHKIQTKMIFYRLAVLLNPRPAKFSEFIPTMTKIEKKIIIKSIESLFLDK